MFDEKGDLTSEFPRMKREAEDCMGRNQIPEALRAICVPLGSKDQSVRDSQAAVAAAVMNHVKEADVQGHVDKLSEEERSSMDLRYDSVLSSQLFRINVVKFVYRAMHVYTMPSTKSSGAASSTTEKNCNTLLKWLTTITDKDGQGVVMKALVDTRV